MNITGNPNLIDSIRIAKSLGCEVTYPRRTGELCVRHHALLRPIVVNSRRKDSSRILVQKLRQLAKLAGEA